MASARGWTAEARGKSALRSSEFARTLALLDVEHWNEYFIS